MESTAKKMVSNLSEAIDIGFFDVEKAEFYLTPGGFTGLRYGEMDYKRISLRRALPIERPFEYISVADHENKEIGIIRSVDELSQGQKKIVLDELNRRYFCPEVLEVKSVKDKLGYVYFEFALKVEEQIFNKNCAVKDVSKNIRAIDDKRLIIFDVDGNRYMINSLSELDGKSLKRLEPYLF